jgi:tetratricopeptide (TPR) repeat protein
MQLERFSRTALAVFMLAAGCATTQPELGMEAPGRPAVTWHSENQAASPSPDAGAPTTTERELLAELHDAEKPGSNQLALADTLYNLAILRRQQGALVEAEQLYRRALAIRERELGANHPDVAVILNNLAVLEAAEGSYDDAQPLFERALAIRQSALGDAHVLTAQSLNNLGLLYAAQGDSAAAEPLYQHALAILEKTDVAATGHPQTHGAYTVAPSRGDPQGDELARVLDNYAALLHDTGRDAEAAELEARARTLHGGEATDPPR